MDFYRIGSKQSVLIKQDVLISGSKQNVLIKQDVLISGSKQSVLIKQDVLIFRVSTLTQEFYKTSHN